MKRGPKPLPRKILESRGSIKRNPERHADREFEPEDLEELPTEPPEYLTGDQQAAWLHIYRHLPSGVVFAPDALALEMTARLWAKLWAGDITSIEFKQLNAMLGQFGMNPSDRTRVRQLGKPKKKNPFLTKAG